MTLQECYTALGGDYDEVLGRLRSESLVQKFVLKFPADPSYDMLQTALAAQDWAEAFRGAHTIKGVCQNLAFTHLAQSSSALTEALRSGMSPEAPGLLEKVKADYQRTVSAIQEFQASL